MKFSTARPENAETEVSRYLESLLATGTRVLWLVSGGSCIPYETHILRNLSSSYSELLRVMLVDERFGLSGHAASNYKQLTNAGFSRDGLFFDDILATSQPLEITTARYSALLRESMEISDVIIATLGIGADGHTAGILPKSPALLEAKDMAIGFVAPDFIRITASLHTLGKVMQAYIFAYGSAKQEVVEQLYTHRYSISYFPAAILYDIPSVTIYNDNIRSEG